MFLQFHHRKEKKGTTQNIDQTLSQQNKPFLQNLQDFIFCYFTVRYMKSELIIDCTAFRVPVQLKFVHLKNRIYIHKINKYISMVFLHNRNLEKNAWSAN